MGNNYLIIALVFFPFAASLAADAVAVMQGRKAA